MVDPHRVAVVIKSRVALIELDPRFVAPRLVEVLRRDRASLAHGDASETQIDATSYFYPLSHL